MVLSREGDTFTMDATIMPSSGNEITYKWVYPELVADEVGFYLSVDGSYLDIITQVTYPFIANIK